MPEPAVPRVRGPAVRISLMLCLPRDSSTLPVVRHIAAAALKELGVEAEAIDDVSLALTEAAANVVKHSGADDQYEVHLVLENHTCEIRVVDTGHGFDSESLEERLEDLGSESGRGVNLMRALVGRIEFISKPETGTVVHLEKMLELRDDGPAAELLRRRDGKDR